MLAVGEVCLIDLPHGTMNQSMRSRHVLYRGQGGKGDTIAGFQSLPTVDCRPSEGCARHSLPLRPINTVIRLREIDYGGLCIEVNTRGVPYWMSRHVVEQDHRSGLLVNRLFVSSATDGRNYLQAPPPPTVFCMRVHFSDGTCVAHDACPLPKHCPGRRNRTSHRPTVQNWTTRHLQLHSSGLCEGFARFAISLLHCPHQPFVQCSAVVASSSLLTGCGASTLGAAWS